MSRQELTGFLDRWQEDVLNPYVPRIPNSNDAGDIDWSQLESWSVGNSISVDQSVISTTRRVVDLLFQKRRDLLFLEEIQALGAPDVNRMQNWPDSDCDAGEGHESYTEETTHDPDCRTCVHYRMIPNNLNGIEYGVCRAWQELASGDVHGTKGCCDSHCTKLGWNPRTIDKSGGIGYQDLKDRFGGPLNKGQIKPNWRKAARALMWFVENEKAQLIDGNGTLVVPADYEDLMRTLDADRRARVVLTADWDVYIYARWGGEKPGGEWALQRVPAAARPKIRSDLHIVLGETLGRAYNWNKKESDFDQRGINQYKAREYICNQAQGRAPVHVTSEEYYYAFRANNAGHMADSYLHRALQDENAATFEFVDTGQPEWGRFIVDERLVRWREWNRTRGREH